MAASALGSGANINLSRGDFRFSMNQMQGGFLAEKVVRDLGSRGKCLTSDGSRSHVVCLFEKSIDAVSATTCAAFTARAFDAITFVAANVVNVFNSKVAAAVVAASDFAACLNKARVASSYRVARVVRKEVALSLVANATTARDASASLNAAACNLVAVVADVSAAITAFKTTTTRADEAAADLAAAANADTDRVVGATLADLSITIQDRGFSTANVAYADSVARAFDAITAVVANVVNVVNVFNSKVAAASAAVAASDFAACLHKARVVRKEVALSLVANATTAKDASASLNAAACDLVAVYDSILTANNALAALSPLNDTVADLAITIQGRAINFAVAHSALPISSVVIVEACITDKNVRKASYTKVSDIADLYTTLIVIALAVAGNNNAALTDVAKAFNPSNESSNHVDVSALHYASYALDEAIGARISVDSDIRAAARARARATKHALNAAFCDRNTADCTTLNIVATQIATLAVAIANYDAAAVRLVAAAVKTTAVSSANEAIRVADSFEVFTTASIVADVAVLALEAAADAIEERRRSS